MLNIPCENDNNDITSVECSMPTNTLLSEENRQGIGSLAEGTGTNVQASPTHMMYEQIDSISYNGQKVPQASEDDQHDYEDPYEEPATKEEELLLQLQRLNVEMITQDSIT